MQDCKIIDDAARIKTRLGVVIINYRTAALTIQCLETLHPQLAAVGGYAIIVDNNSGDGSADDIARWIESAGAADCTELVRSPRNAGFSGGNNIGLKKIDAEFYLLLNSDTLLREDALQSMITAMGAHPNAGALGPRLEYEDGEPQQSAFRFISPVSEFLAGAETGPISKLLKGFQVALPLPSTPVQCDWVSFACVLLRGDAVFDAGMMDEGFFMYFEDADYCRTLKKTGWSTVYDPSAKVVHLRGGSSPVKKAIAEKKRPPAYYYEARTRYFRKGYGPTGLFMANVLWLAGRIIARLRSVIGKTAPGLCEYQGRDYWTNWRTPLKSSEAPK